MIHKVVFDGSPFICMYNAYLGYSLTDDFPFQLINAEMETSDLFNKTAQMICAARESFPFCVTFFLGVFGDRLNQVQQSRHDGSGLTFCVLLQRVH